jgi:LysM repeat protein
LFTLKITDYEGWAHGLKKAGYATDPQYAQRLIRIIEEYDLAKYDQKDVSSLSNNNNSRNNHNAKPKPNAKPVETNIVRENFNGFSPVNYPYTLRTVYMNNGTYFVVAKQGDTFYDIAVDVQLGVAELRRYNDVPHKKYEPNAGEMVYLKQKKNYAEVGQHILQPDETLHSVAQRYGCRLSSIYKLNNIDKSETNVETGMRLQLKK